MSFNYNGMKIKVIITLILFRRSANDSGRRKNELYLQRGRRGGVRKREQEKVGERSREKKKERHRETL